MLFNSLSQATHALIPRLLPHQIILLRGDLASGKTTFVSHLAKEMGIQDPITSPTFSLQNIYSSPHQTLFHYDLYRKDLEECLELGLLEMLEIKGWHFIEWGDERLESLLRQSGFAMIIITISKNDQNHENNRIYRISF